MTTRGRCREILLQFTTSYPFVTFKVPLRQNMHESGSLLDFRGADRQNMFESVRDKNEGITRVRILY